jgi:hypothetical protein
LIAVQYGPKHKATQSPFVSVGETYTLNCEVAPSPPKYQPASVGSGGQTGIIQVGNAKIGNHLSSASLHHITLYVPGDKNAILNGTGNHCPHIFLPNFTPEHC